MKENFRNLNLPSVFFIFIFLFQNTGLFAQDTVQYIQNNRINSPQQQSKPYVIMISADGFRYDFARRFSAKNLLQFANNGVEATSMQPSFPTLTFPNHYSLVTGLYPAHHGIVDNRFYDPSSRQVYAIGQPSVLDNKWYGGTPLWVLAEKQQMLSASFFWVGSKSDVQQTRPTYYFNYSEVFTFSRRLQILKDWLQLPPEKRPHLITFYFPEVDHAAHRYGVYSKETQKAVKELDESVAAINRMAQASGLPINFIFVSDHGFTDVDTTNTLPIPDLDTAKFIVSYGSTMVHYYAKNKKDILPAYNDLKKSEKNYKVFLAQDVPAQWHFGQLDDYYGRIGDILLLADQPRIFYKRGRKNTANHGYDNFSPEMQSTFFAWGPAFRKNLKINSFENIHVYPLVAKILGLTFDPASIDGRLEVLEGILK